LYYIEEIAVSGTVVAVCGGITAYVLTCLYQWKRLTRGEKKDPGP